MNNQLIEASKKGDLKTVKNLIKNGADVHALTDSALRYASQNGHLEVVKLLIVNDANVHADNNYALRWASENGHTEVVKLLIENDADVHTDNNCALRWAFENGHTEVVKLLENAIMKKIEDDKRIETTKTVLTSNNKRDFIISATFDNKEEVINWLNKTNIGEYKITVTIN